MVMRLWRIGNAILMLLVLPLVIYLLNRVLAALERMPEALSTTDQTVRDVSAGATRYAGSVAKLLG
jgi:hypothetical protein